MLIIDKIQSTYKELFTVRLVHPGFDLDVTYRDPVSDLPKILTVSSIFNVLSFEPDIATKSLFDGCFVNYKYSNNMLICYTRTLLQKPYITFPDGASLRFMIQVQTDFINKTNAPLQTGKVYQFTNENRTGTTGNRFINKVTTGVSEINDLKNVLDVAPEKSCFAVVDILTNVTNPLYSLFSNAGNLESPDYKILFKKK